MKGVASVLESVTVYRQGAICVRTAQVVGGAVEGSQIRVVGLPLVAIATSLRARVTGDDAVHVLDVRAGFEVELGEQTDLAAEVRALEEATAQSLVTALAISRLERELAELGGLLPEFREPRRREGPRPAPVEAMLALAEFVDQRTEALHASRRKLAIELEDASERERTCAARLREAGAAARTSRATITRAAIVTLTMTPRHDCTLAIEYEVSGARWLPTYQLALGDAGQGRLAMRASIAQRTGEDWSSVRLALGTASLRRRTRVPELRALRVGRAQPEPQSAGWREVPQGLDTLFADYDAAKLQQPAKPVVPPRPPPRAAVHAPLPAVPQPAPMAAFASFGAPGAGAAPTAMPQSARAPMPRMSAPMPSRAAAMESSAEQDDEGAFHNLESTGTDLSLPPQPVGPSDALLDYEGLQLQGPATGSRGRLAPAPHEALVFAAGVHIEIDVVLAAVSRAQRSAAEIAGLPPPRNCTAATAQDGFDYRFDAPAPADVPSTGAWTNVAVMDCEVACIPRYVCVPAMDPAVYRTLEIENRSAHALLPGPLDVSRGGQFLLTTTLAAVGPHARGRRVGLGVEESIKVARNTRFAESSGGLFGGQSVLAHEIDIAIDNRLGAEIDLEVRERVPVVDANEKDLKLEEHEAEPPWTAVDQPEDGVLVHGLRRWRLKVAPRAKARLLAKYTVRIPADRTLVGGNRRS